MRRGFVLMKLEIPSASLKEANPARGRNSELSSIIMAKAEIRPPARSIVFQGSIDDGFCRLKRRLYTHFRGIKQV